MRMFVQPEGLAWAAIALLLSSATSILLELKLARSLLWAAARALFQLLALGTILSWVFQSESSVMTFGLVIIMTVVAAHTIFNRVASGRYPGLAFHSFLSLVLGAWAFSFYAGKWVLASGSWHKPEVIL